MKKLILVLAGVAFLAGGAFTSQVGAQIPATGEPPPTQQTGTRVAIVNIGMVFHNYKRATEFKGEIEALMKPYKEKAERLQKEAKAWHDEMQKPTFPKEERARYDKAIIENKRKLEDMQLDVQKLLSKKQEDNLIILWKDVNMAIDRVAKSYGFQIVLGYGDPVEKAMIEQFANINRKMQAMDQGSTIPLYIHESIDISPVVADILNKWMAGANNQGGLQKISGTR